MRQRGFAHARHVLDQQMTSRKQACQRLADLQFLSDDNLADLRGDSMEFGEHEFFVKGMDKDYSQIPRITSFSYPPYKRVGAFDTESSNYTKQIDTYLTGKK